MKKLSLFYTSRFLFQRGSIDAFSGYPGGRPPEFGPVKPEVEKRSSKEIHDAQRATVKDIYMTRRDRVRMLQSKKKVAGEKVSEKTVRVSDNTMVVKLNGMPDRVDPMDNVKVLNGGQVYEMGGQKYVKVEVRGKRSTSKGKVKDTYFAAYLQLDAVREPREVEGNKMIEAYVDEVQKYLDNVAKHRFYIHIKYDAPEGPTVIVHDTEQGNRVVSWALLDIGKDALGNYMDVDVAGNTGTFLFRQRERQYGRQSSATVVMGTSGTNPDATYDQDPEVRAGKAPEPDKRVRLHGPDTVHYSLNGAVGRVKKEIDYYLQKNPSRGFPGPGPGDADFEDNPGERAEKEKAMHKLGSGITEYIKGEGLDNVIKVEYFEWKEKNFKSLMVNYEPLSFSSDDMDVIVGMQLDEIDPLQHVQQLAYFLSKIKDFADRKRLV